MDSAANNKNLNKSLDEIAEKLKNGGKYEDILEELDEALGTKLKERDLEIEKIFEMSKGENN